MPLIFLLLSLYNLYAIPAFPEAEGWGKNSVGGRGGEVIHVTTLSSSGTGSLRAACATNGAKIIVFDVGGVINLNNTPIPVNSSTYIAGQTAPGGITLTNGGLYISGNDVIVRFIRVRRSANAADGDCFRITNAVSHDIIIDHCSGYWASDEILDMSYKCYNITIQNTIIAEPLQCSYFYCSEVGCGNNRTGTLSTDNDGRISFYKCIMTHAMKRTPMCSNGGKTANTGKTFEFINNVVYNCMAGSSESFDNGNTIPLNLIGNYYKGGLSADYGSNPYAHSGTINPKSMAAFVSGNFHSKYPTTTLSAAFFNANSVNTFETTIITPLMTDSILPVQLAYEKCLLSTGVLPRDSTERRTVLEIANRGGAWEEDCYPPNEGYMSGMGSVPTDTDRDGMPDAWETANGLNPANAADRNTDMGGYTAIEVYLNALADSIINASVNSVEIGKIAIGMPVILLDVLPNPSNSLFKFMVTTKNSAPVILSIYDIKGSIVYKSNINTNHSSVYWDASQAGNGVYFAIAKQGGNSVRKILYRID